MKNIYNQVHVLYKGQYIFPMNICNTKNLKLLPLGNPICKAGLTMWKGGKFPDCSRTHQKFCCLLKSSINADCPYHHKNFYNVKEHHGRTKYIAIPSDLRLSIDIENKHFKNSYSLRT